MEIREIIDVLHSGSFHNIGPNIEIVKGKNSIPKTWKDGIKKIIRVFKYRIR